MLNILSIPINNISITFLIVKSIKSSGSRVYKTADSSLMFSEHFTITISKTYQRLTYGVIVIMSFESAVPKCSTVMETVILSETGEVV